jgi:hypothetical protein
MLWSAIDYAGKLGLVGALLLAVGLPLYGLSSALGRPRENFYSPDRRVQP